MLIYYIIGDPQVRVKITQNKHKGNISLCIAKYVRNVSKLNANCKIFTSYFPLKFAKYQNISFDETRQNNFYQFV